jgi:DNA-directed RNA polymerase delta subunit
MTTNASQNDTSILKVLKSSTLNLKKVLEEMFLVLTEKEKDVITKRFSLNNKPRQTLDRIGKYFNVTRERIRQIESIALGKLRRNVSNSKLRYINRLAKEILKKNGGVMMEDRIISEVLNNIHTTSRIDGHIIRLSLTIDSDLIQNERTSTYDPFWRFSEIDLKEIKIIIENAINILEKKSELISNDQLVGAIQSLDVFKTRKPTNDFILSTLSIDRRIKKIDQGWGLMSWRNVNPKSIRDKANIVLQKAGKPLHFVEIANRIAEVGFDKKIVTVQAVHNELIRYAQFVLVGRGLYALSEWGYQPGTVSDVIEDLLKKNGPMSKKEIIEKVLNQRQVKIGTISLNLQKKAQFVRVGRAVYNYQEK